MKVLTLIIAILCLGMAIVASNHIFTPIPEGGVCTVDGQTINPDELKNHHLLWGIALFTPLIMLFIGAFMILVNKEETRGEKIGSYVFLASVLALIVVLALCGG